MGHKNKAEMPHQRKPAAGLLDHGRVDDGQLVRYLTRWFTAHARELPWRTVAGHRGSGLGQLRDPYRVLVSEIMLQQTQVLRVVERFEAFMARFPRVEDLAAADQAAVLGLWSGLGYYRRARSLHAAARYVVNECSGRFPQTVEGLLRLPGVGRYTAGAIASLAFGQCVAAVDGNVSRVLLRLEGVELAANEREAQRYIWDRAQALVETGRDQRLEPGMINESLIELGATVCRKANPGCDACPLNQACQARAQGKTNEIPVSTNAKARSRLYLASVIIEDERDRVLVARRPDNGMWAGLIEAPTLESKVKMPSVQAIRRFLKLSSGKSAASTDRLHATIHTVGSFDFATTHRECRFAVYHLACENRQALEPHFASIQPGWMFLKRDALHSLGLSRPQERILLEMGRTVRA